MHRKTEGRTYTLASPMCAPLALLGEKSTPMAIYHCSVKLIGRSAGRSATASAAYRAGEKIEDERTGEVHDYTRKSDVSHSQIFAPDGAPDWVHDRARLWNEVEKIEKRKDSQLAREVEVSIPRELDPQAGRDLVHGFVVEQFVSKGMVADVCIHGEGGANPHAHVLLTTREITRDGFGKKDRSWNGREVLQGWRDEWERHANLALEKAGEEARIDCRTLEAQGIDREPQIHHGNRPEVMEKNDGIIARNIKKIRAAAAAVLEEVRHFLSKEQGDEVVEELAEVEEEVKEHQALRTLDDELIYSEEYQDEYEQEYEQEYGEENTQQHGEAASPEAFRPAPD